MHTKMSNFNLIKHDQYSKIYQQQSCSSLSVIKNLDALEVGIHLL